MANIIAIGGGGKGEEYFSGTLTTIDNQNKINVNMTKSTPQDIAQQSEANPNVLFFTEGTSDTELKIFTATVTLSSASWVSNLQSVNIQGITNSTNIIVSPLSDSGTNFDDYCNAGIRAISQSTGVVQFKCNTVPANNIYVNLAYWSP